MVWSIWVLSGGSREPEKIAEQGWFLQGMCIRRVMLGLSVGADGGGSWEATQHWGLWHHVEGLGFGGRGAGTEEGPAQTETRRRLCFGTESPSPLCSLPTSASLAISSSFGKDSGSAGKVAQPPWLSPHGPPV